MLEHAWDFSRSVLCVDYDVSTKVDDDDDCVITIL